MCNTYWRTYTPLHYSLFCPLLYTPSLLHFQSSLFVQASVVLHLFSQDGNSPYFSCSDWSCSHSKSGDCSRTIPQSSPPALCTEPSPTHPLQSHLSISGHDRRLSCSVLKLCLNCANNNGKIKEHDPDSVTCFIQQIWWHLQHHPHDRPTEVQPLTYLVTLISIPRWANKVSSGLSCCGRIRHLAYHHRRQTDEISSEVEFYIAVHRFLTHIQTPEV